MPVSASVWRRIKPIFRAVGLLPSAGHKETTGRKAAISIPRPRPRIEPTRYLSVVAVVKNEGRYLREWLEFQRLMGADHVYLYDNGSTDSTDEVLAPFVAEGFVTAVPWITFDHDLCRQRLAYAHALSNFGPDFRWMAFIDLDEFLFPVAASSLVDALSDYEDDFAICVPWFMFGHCGHETPPAGLVIENYTARASYPPKPRCEPLMKWKSIVQPAAVVAVNSVHMFNLSNGITGGVDENREPVIRKTERPPPPGKIFRLNHYFTRSRQEFAVKAKDGGLGNRGPRKRQRLANMIEAETVYDDTILRFAPALRARMKGEQL